VLDLIIAYHRMGVPKGSPLETYILYQLWFNMVPRLPSQSTITRGDGCLGLELGCPLLNPSLVRLFRYISVPSCVESGPFPTLGTIRDAQLPDTP
jgi:hypothetical protein